MRALSHRRVFAALLLGLVALTWLGLWLWDQSPYGRYLVHGQWDRAGVAARLCGAVPLGGIVVPAAFYVLSWVLMTVAMMLPTTLPLLEMFRRLAAGRPDRGRLLALLVAGYLAVWAGFGLVAHLLDWLVFRLAEQVAVLTFNAWAFSAGVLLLAGLFQFSALKYRCLEQCRMPLSFVLRRWRGRAPRREALLLGVQHGAFCVGCCWALMLLMFALGTGSIGWMLLLGAVMAAEKNLAWGRRLSAPLGALLIAAAGVVAATNLAGAAA
jgi:predicted metal-binding membrane protein